MRANDQRLLAELHPRAPLHERPAQELNEGSVFKYVTTLYFRSAAAEAADELDVGTAETIQTPSKD